MKKTIITALVLSMLGSFLAGCKNDADKQKDAAEKAFQGEMARMAKDSGK